MKLNLEIIEKRLTELNLTKYGLAQKMDVSPQWVYFLFSGFYSHSFKTVERLANALGLNGKDLVS
jgi:plasmid maintenance system antidote protein VapI